MSNKKSNELAIQGRRLRPVYDALDNGQNKKAVQEADKVLKKHPGTCAAKALKALALIRMERSSEALGLVAVLEDEVKAGNYDENFIQAICHCYKEGFMPERIVALYESLAKDYPKDENVISQLFLAHVRVGNYKEQQRLALQLYKEYNLPPYLMWSIMSMIMQGLEDPKIGQAMFYPLAEKMMNKMTNGYTFKGEEVDLYLMVLEMRGKIAEAITYIENNPALSENLVYGTKGYHCLNRLYYMNSNYETLVERVSSCLQKEVNDWSSWQFFIDAFFQLIDAAAESGRMEDVTLIFSRMMTFVTGIMTSAAEADGEKSSIGDMQRGPLMACLEVTNRVRKSQRFSDEQIAALPHLETPIHYVRQLIKATHTKPYCFADVKQYLHLLMPADIDILIEFTEWLCPEAPAPDDVGEDNKVSRDIILVERNWNDLLREELIWSRVTHCDTPLTREERAAAVRRLFAKLPPAHFQAGQVASVYGSLIAGYLLESKKTGIPPENVMTMIVVFEHIRRTYADCDRSVLVLLARLYTAFGDVSRVGEMCRQLDIKYIQRESLGFMQFFLAERFGRFCTAIFFYTSISTQYDQSEREIAECAVNSYRNGAFSQITKLIEFQKKCIHSVYSAATDIINRELSSIFGVDSLDVAGSTLLGDDVKIEWEKMCDNRDFSVISGMPCDCCSGRLNDVKEKSFEEMMIAMRMKHHMCRTIGVLASSDVSVAIFRSEFDTFRRHYNEVKEFCEQNKDKQSVINNFSHLNLITTIMNGYHDISVALFEFISVVLEDGDAAPDLDAFKAVVEKVVTAKLPKEKSELPLSGFVEFLELCANSLRVLVSCLLAIKFMERRKSTTADDRVKQPKHNDNNNGCVDNGRPTKKLNAFELLAKCEEQIIDALNQVRTALTSYLSSLDLELRADLASENIDKTSVCFPDIAFDFLLDPEDKSVIAEQTRTMLTDLGRNIEKSMKNSFVESIQESIGALLRADTKLFGKDLSNSMLKWPQMMIDKLSKLNM